MGWISQLEHFVEKLAQEKKRGKSLKTYILFPSTSIFWLSWSRTCACLPLFQLTWGCPSYRTLVCIHDNPELLYPVEKLEWCWILAVRSCLCYCVLPIPVIRWRTDKINTVACWRNACFSKMQPWFFPETTSALQNFLMCFLRKLDLAQHLFCFFFFSLIFLCIF